MSTGLLSPQNWPKKINARKHWIMPPKLMPRLVSTARHKIMPPTKTLRALGLRRGMAFMDAGCGPGFFTLPACRIVGASGQVLASDISPAMVRELRFRSKQSGIKNLLVKKSNDPNIPFPDKSADMVMLGFVLHESAEVEVFLSGVERALRPGGRLVGSEWHPRETEYGPPLWARLDIGETKRLLRGSGMSIVASWSFDDDTYFVMAHRKSRAKGVGLLFQPPEKVTRRQGAKIR